MDAAARPGGLVGYYLDRSRARGEVVPDLVAAVDAEEPIQVMFGGARAEMEALLPVLAAELGSAARIERTVYPSTGVVLLDVLAPLGGQGGGARLPAGALGHRPSETLAIGDNWNDREMVERAGLGFVMGNADPELLALGLPALPTNDEDGVAHAIEEHVLARVAPEERERGGDAAEPPSTTSPPEKKWGARSLSTPPTSPGLLLLLLGSLLLGSLLLRRH